MSDEKPPVNPLSKTLTSIEANLQATMFALAILLPTLRHSGDLDAELFLERVDDALSRPPGKAKGQEFADALLFISSLLREEVEGLKEKKDNET